MKNIFLILLLFAAFACNKSAEKTSEIEFPTATPESVGLHSDSLATLEDHIQWAIDSQFISGAVMLVAKDNKVVFHKALGYANREKTEPLTVDHIFRMASMTKPIVSVAIMQLVEQGKLNLTDPVSKYIPEFYNPVVFENFNPEDSTYTTRPAVREVTIHHLLTHTSGLAYGAFDPVIGTVYAPFGITEAWTKDSVRLKTNVPKMGKLPLSHDPGVQFTYGISIDVLGYVVEVVSGIPLDAYLQKNIFTLLNMTDTYFYLPEEKNNRLVEVWYTKDFDSNIFPELNRDDYPIQGFKTYFSGGGGLSSTTSDYLKFASALLNQGEGNGNRVLTPETVTQMMTNQIDTLYIDKHVQFGYGGSVFTSDGESGQRKGRFGWDGFWQTRFWVDPQRNLVGIVLSNAIYTTKWGLFLNGYEEIVNNAVTEE